MKNTIQFQLSELVRQLLAIPEIDSAELNAFYTAWDSAWNLSWVCASEAQAYVDTMVRILELNR